MTRKEMLYEMLHLAQEEHRMMLGALDELLMKSEREEIEAECQKWVSFIATLEDKIMQCKSVTPPDSMLDKFNSIIAVCKSEFEIYRDLYYIDESEDNYINAMEWLHIQDVLRDMRSRLM